MLTNEPLINIGIYTDGVPQITTQKGVTILNNMLIGKDFHWQHAVKASLPGKIKLFDQLTNGVYLINTLPLETYLECVIGSEMNPEAELEFLKAHAVISRSWALNKLQHLNSTGYQQKAFTPNMLISWEENDDHNGFDLCSDDHCQRYQGIPETSECVARAIAETRGFAVIDSNGRIADTRFSKCCGGRTELFSSCWSSENPNYLKSIADPYCDLSDMPLPLKDRLLSTSLKNYDQLTANFHDWNTSISKKKIKENLLAKFDRNVGEILTIEVLERGASGRAMIIRIVGSERSLILGKELMIRRLLSDSHLNSSLFEIEDHGEFITLSGKGWGHGVGLCQIGAARMAFDGASFSDILNFYYPNTTLTKLYV